MSISAIGKSNSGISEQQYFGTNTVLGLRLPSRAKALHNITRTTNQSVILVLVGYNRWLLSDCKQIVVVVVVVSHLQVLHTTASASDIMDRQCVLPRFLQNATHVLAPNLNDQCHLVGNFVHVDERVLVGANQDVQGICALAQSNTGDVGDCDGKLTWDALFDERAFL
jgi:hypothetical protein